MACSEFIRGLALNVNNKRTISVDGMTGIRKCTNSKEKNWRGGQRAEGRMVSTQQKATTTISITDSDDYRASNHQPSAP